MPELSWSVHIVQGTGGQLDPAPFFIFPYLTGMPREKTYTQNTGPARRPAWLAGGNDPAGRVLLVMVAFECFPCVRIIPKMKHWTA